MAVQLVVFLQYAAIPISKMKKCFFIFFCLLPVVLLGQPLLLKPSIGLPALPADGAPICSIPVYSGSFYTSGYSVGDTIPDFTLYTVSGTPVNMATVLASHKPLLLVAGSYTCPVFRDKMADVNSMAAFYGGLLDIYIVYVVEAHPNVNPSPYSGTIWVTSQNVTDGVLYAQPATYGQRKNMVDTMLAHMTVSPTVLVDGPCNEWWSHFGPAPNNTYLIDTNGTIRAKHGWYNRLPDNMWCSIDTLLGTSSGHCVSVPGNGNFSIRLLDDSTVTGTAGSVLTIHGMLTNLSSSATATVSMKKLNIAIPSGWATAFCTDVCLSSTVDSTAIIMAPSDSQSVIFYFYTDAIPASGNVQVGFKNPSNSSNSKKQRYYATTSPASVAEGITNLISWYPNPAKNHLHIRASAPFHEISLLSVSGAAVSIYKGPYIKETKLLLSDFSKGMYLLELRGDNWCETKKIEIQ